MSLPKILFVAATALLITACAAPTPDISHQNPFGKWSTKIETQSGASLSHGVMTFTNKKKATYTLRNGRILFNEIDDQGRWKGRWVENTQPWVSCPDEVDGSKAWGEAIFQFDPTYNKFKGTWDKCGDGNRNAWVGHRI